MERLFIAEKDELANAIADVLGVTKKERGIIYCGNDAIVSTGGHALELYAPEDYNPEHERWNLEHLPIVNIPWKYKVIASKKQKYKLICDCIKQAKIIVHAGDTDPEGQLLVDEILAHQNVTKPVKRILINDNNPRIVRRSLDNMRDNKEFSGLSSAALSRSVGDQLYGFNLTRLYTLMAQAIGGTEVLSVGRVQTPILGLIVARDRLIESHQKQYYYLLKAGFDVSGVQFQALYQTKESDAVDDKGRLTEKSEAEALALECESKRSEIKSVSTKEKRESPPLPYDLLGLQSDAYRKFGHNSKKTLDLTQRLRQKKLITYNRTDCRYLSDEQHEDAPIVLSAITDNAPALAGAASAADTSIKGKAFDSSKVTAHHGIVPGEGRYDIADLPADEQQIYLLIARQYIAQFWPAKVSSITTVILETEGSGHRFKATATTIVDPGWSRLYKNDSDNEDIAESTQEDDTNANLQKLATDQSGQCVTTTIDNKETKPPSHYTESTLLKDLRRVAKYVKDKKIAALLLEKDKDSKEEQGGIGTPATRHTYIDTLKNRGFISDQKGKLISTDLGRDFHDTLPSMATQPDMTALWYEQQKHIESLDMTLDSFLEGLVAQVSDHIETVKSEGIELKISKAPQCYQCKIGFLRLRKGKNGKFWACLRYPECNATYPDKSGKPDFTPKPKAVLSEHPCKKCGKPLVLRKSKPKKGKKAAAFFGCSGYPDCKTTYFEKNGKPNYETAKK